MGGKKKIDLGEEYYAEVVEEKYNPLINRKEITLIIYHIGKGTPQRKTVREKVAVAYGVEINRVYVRNILGEFGIGRSKAIVHVYDSVERARMFEPLHVIRKNEGEQ